MKPRLPRLRTVLRFAVFGVLGSLSAVMFSVGLGLLPYWAESLETETRFRTTQGGDEVIVRKEVMPGRREYTIRGPNPLTPIPEGIDVEGASPDDRDDWRLWWDYRKDDREWDEQRALPERAWGPPWWWPSEDQCRPRYEHPAIDPTRGFQPWVSFTAVGFPFTMFLDRDSLDTRPNYSEVDAPKQLLPWYEPLIVHRDYLAMVKTRDVSDHFSVTYHIEVPLRVVPLGMTLNIAAHAMAWWVLLAAPFALQRALRRRAGRCVKCKYDLTGLTAGEPCPECGRVDGSRAAASTPDPSPATSSTA